MSTIDSRRLDPPAMTAHDIEMARVAERCIMEAMDRSRAAVITLTSEEGDQPPVELPPQALRLIAQVLGAISEGRPILLMPSKRELSTVEAAHILNVSRPFVIKEIEARRLKHHMVGSHRRIAFDELMAYRDRMRKSQEEALDRLAQNAQELGLDQY